MDTRPQTGMELEIEAAIEKRIEEMEKPDYPFPKRLVKSDYIVVGIVAALCLVLVIAGASL